MAQTPLTGRPPGPSPAGRATPLPGDRRARRWLRRLAYAAAIGAAPEQSQATSTGLPTSPPTPTGATDEPRSAGAGARTGASGRRGRLRAPERWAPSPRLPAGEIAIVCLTGLLLAILVTWPLVLHLPSRIAPDLGDPIRTAWEIAWVGHALTHSPLHIFDANAFYPHKLSLAFSDSLLGYGPTALIGSGTVAALVRYNLLFLFAWSLCYVGAYLLARELGLKRLGAAASGIAFAYAPYRITEAGHLHVISSGGVALTIFLLLRGYRRRSTVTVAFGWLACAWQMSLGFTLGTQMAYLMAIIAIVVFVAWWRGRLRPSLDAAAQEAAAGGRATGAGEGAADAEGQGGGPAAPSAPAGVRGPLIPRRLLVVTILGVLLLGGVTVYQARPYLKINQQYPTAKRTIKEVENYSSGPAAWLAASSENRAWGGVTEGMRDKVHSKNESVFFPGGVILVLAIAGLFAPVYTRRLRGSLAIGIAVVSILALGLGLTGAGYPYRLLFDYAPGFNGVRVPGRIFTLATLFYALLAGAGVQLAVWWAARFGERHRLSALGPITGVVLAALVLVEGAGHMAHPVVPQPAAAEVGLKAPLMDLPTDGPADRLWQYFSTNGFYPIPTGNSTFDFPAVDDLRGGMSGFPDRASIEKLRYYGIKTVVLHLKMPTLPGIHGYALAEPADSAAAAAKPIDGLGVTRRRVGDLVIYSIGPGPASLHGTG